METITIDVNSIINEYGNVPGFPDIESVTLDHDFNERIGIAGIGIFDAFKMNFKLEEKEFRIKFDRSKDIDEGTMYIGEIGCFVGFGFKDNTRQTGHGGLWSSNPAAVYRVLGVPTISIDLMAKYNIGGYVKVEAMNKFLPEGYKLVLVNTRRSYDYGDWKIVSDETYNEIKEYLLTFEQFENSREGR